MMNDKVIKTIKFVYDDKYTRRFEKMMYAIDHRLLVMKDDGSIYEFTGFGFHKGTFETRKHIDSYYKLFNIGCYRPTEPTISIFDLLRNDFEILDRHQDVSDEDKRRCDIVEGYRRAQRLVEESKENSVVVEPGPFKPRSWFKSK